MVTILLFSLPTIIDTIPAFKWTLIWLYMGVDVEFSVGWFEEGEAALIGPDSVLYPMEKVQLIRDRHKKAQSRQKSYVDVCNKKGTRLPS